MSDHQEDEAQTDIENKTPEENVDKSASETKEKDDAPVLALPDPKKRSLKAKLLANKKLATIVALCLVLVLAGGVYAIVRPDKNQQSAEEQAAKKEVTRITATVSYIEGVVEKKDGTTYTEIATNTTLSEGDTIRTSGVNSRATIALENGSFTRLNGDTEVTLTSLKSDEIVIMQENGQVYSRVSPSTEGTYAVETNTNTYMANGTAFKTTASGDEESVEVYDSSVTEGTKPEAINQGEKLFVKNTQDKTKEGTVQPLDIEVVKADSFVKWCRDEDEKSEEFKDKLGFLKDITSPTLTITSPANNSTVTVESTATSGSVSFKGTAEKGSTVTIQSVSVAGSAPVAVTLKDDGSFESDAIAGIIGTSKYEVIAKDTAGNKQVLTIAVLFKKKAGSITLSNKGLVDGKYRMSWTLASGFTVEEGFKVTWNTTGSPTYPKTGDNSGAEFAEADSRQADIYLSPKTGSSTTYYVRVCRYDDGECDTYSNQVTVTVPAKTE